LTYLVAVPVAVFPRLADCVVTVLRQIDLAVPNFLFISRCVIRILSPFG
jgi:hypothetical protein